MQVHVSNFEGVSGSTDRGGSDSSIQFINFERVGDKGFNPIRPGGGLRGPDGQTHSCQSETSYPMMPKLGDF